MKTTKKQLLLRDNIFSHMSLIPFSGVRIIKFIRTDKPIVLYDKPYDHSLITIALNRTSLLVFVDKKQIIFPLDTDQLQIEALDMLKDNGIMPTDKEWVSALVYRTPMVPLLLEQCKKLLKEKTIISLSESKEFFNNQERENIRYTKISLRPENKIWIYYEDRLVSHIYFQHPDEYSSAAKIIENNNLFMPYDVLHE